MNITTTFSPGDKAWVFRDDRAQQLTVGQVRVKVTSSPGIPGESMFSNYSAQEGYEEQYMCVETGINSGSVYTLNEHIFLTEKECTKANVELIAELDKEKLRQHELYREQMLAEESILRAKLAEIEALKSERQMEKD